MFGSWPLHQPIDILLQSTLTIIKAFDDKINLRVNCWGALNKVAISYKNNNLNLEVLHSGNWKPLTNKVG